MPQEIKATYEDKITSLLRDNYGKGGHANILEDKHGKTTVEQHPRRSHVNVKKMRERAFESMVEAVRTSFDKDGKIYGFGTADDKMSLADWMLEMMKCHAAFSADPQNSEADQGDGDDAAIRKELDLEKLRNIENIIHEARKDAFQDDPEKLIDEMDRHDRMSACMQIRRDMNPWEWMKNRKNPEWKIPEDNRIFRHARQPDPITNANRPIRAAIMKDVLESQAAHPHIAEMPERELAGVISKCMGGSRLHDKLTPKRINQTVNAMKAAGLETRHVESLHQLTRLGAKMSTTLSDAATARKEWMALAGNRAGNRPVFTNAGISSAEFSAIDGSVHRIANIFAGIGDMLKVGLYDNYEQQRAFFAVLRDSANELLLAVKKLKAATPANNADRERRDQLVHALRRNADIAHHMAMSLDRPPTVDGGLPPHRFFDPYVLEGFHSDALERDLLSGGLNAEPVTVPTQIYSVHYRDLTSDFLEMKGKLIRLADFREGRTWGEVFQQHDEFDAVKTALGNVMARRSDEKDKSPVSDADICNELIKLSGKGWAESVDFAEYRGAKTWEDAYRSGLESEDVRMAVARVGYWKGQRNDSTPISDDDVRKELIGLGYTKATEKAEADYFGKKGKPSGNLEVPSLSEFYDLGKLDQNEAARLKNAIRDARQNKNSNFKGPATHEEIIDALVASKLQKAITVPKIRAAGSRWRRVYNHDVKAALKAHKADTKKIDKSEQRGGKLDRATRAAGAPYLQESASERARETLTEISIRFNNAVEQVRADRARYDKNKTRENLAALSESLDFACAANDQLKQHYQRIVAKPLRYELSLTRKLGVRMAWGWLPLPTIRTVDKTRAPSNPNDEVAKRQAAIIASKREALEAMQISATAERERMGFAVNPATRILKSQFRSNIGADDALTLNLKADSAVFAKDIEATNRDMAWKALESQPGNEKLKSSLSDAEKYFDKLVRADNPNEVDAPNKGNARWHERDVRCEELSDVATHILATAAGAAGGDLEKSSVLIKGLEFAATLNDAAMAHYTPEQASDPAQTPAFIQGSLRSIGIEAYLHQRAAHYSAAYNEPLSDEMLSHQYFNLASDGVIRAQAVEYRAAMNELRNVVRADHFAEDLGKAFDETDIFRRVHDARAHNAQMLDTLGKTREILQTTGTSETFIDDALNPVEELLTTQRRAIMDIELGLAFERDRRRIENEQDLAARLAGPAASPAVSNHSSFVVMPLTPGNSNNPGEEAQRILLHEPSLKTTPGIYLSEDKLADRPQLAPRDTSGARLALPEKQESAQSGEADDDENNSSDDGDDNLVLMAQPSLAETAGYFKDDDNSSVASSKLPATGTKLAGEPSDITESESPRHARHLTDKNQRLDVPSLIPEGSSSKETGPEDFDEPSDNDDAQEERRLANQDQQQIQQAANYGVFDPKNDKTVFVDYDSDPDDVMNEQEMLAGLPRGLARQTEDLIAELANDDDDDGLIYQLMQTGLYPLNLQETDPIAGMDGPAKPEDYAGWNRQNNNTNSSAPSGVNPDNKRERNSDNKKTAPQVAPRGNAAGRRAHSRMLSLIGASSQSAAAPTAIVEDDQIKTLYTKNLGDRSYKTSDFDTMSIAQAGAKGGKKKNVEPKGSVPGASASEKAGVEKAPGAEKLTSAQKSARSKALVAMVDAGQLAAYAERGMREARERGVKDKTNSPYDNKLVTAMKNVSDAAQSAREKAVNDQLTNEGLRQAYKELGASCEVLLHYAFNKQPANYSEKAKKALHREQRTALRVAAAGYDMAQSFLKPDAALGKSEDSPVFIRDIELLRRLRSGMRELGFIQLAENKRGEALKVPNTVFDHTLLAGSSRSEMEKRVKNFNKQLDKFNKYIPSENAIEGRLPANDDPAIVSRLLSKADAKLFISADASFMEAAKASNRTNAGIRESSAEFQQMGDALVGFRELAQAHLFRDGVLRGLKDDLEAEQQPQNAVAPNNDKADKKRRDARRMAERALQESKSTRQDLELNRLKQKTEQRRNSRVLQEMDAISRQASLHDDGSAVMPETPNAGRVQPQVKTDGRRPSIDEDNDETILNAFAKHPRDQQSDGKKKT